MWIFAGHESFRFWGLALSYYFWPFYRPNQLINEIKSVSCSCVLLLGYTELHSVATLLGRPLQYWVGPPFAPGTAWILRDMDSTKMDAETLLNICFALIRPFKQQRRRRALARFSNSTGAAVIIRTAVAIYSAHTANSSHVSVNHHYAEFIELILKQIHRYTTLTFCLLLCIEFLPHDGLIRYLRSRAGVKW